MRHVGLGFAMAIVVGATGCNSLLGIDDLGLRGDGGPDTGGDAGTACYGVYLRACFDAPPTTELVLDDRFDTDSNNRCITVTQTGGPDVCAVAATRITMTSNTAVSGTRPLMLVATGEIAISQELDAGSRIEDGQNGARVGAGANSTECAPAINGSAATGGGGGGGGASGGSFGAKAGGGGGGMGGGAGASTGASGPQTTTLLRGGCPGGKGGNNQIGGGLGGSGGAGGGAIYLVAPTITITAALRASGAAAGGASAGNAGGGGGGSGGMIVLEGTIAVMDPGQLVANGGGGGEGSKAQSGDNGHDDGDFDDKPDGGNGHDGGDGGDGGIASATIGAGGNGMTGPTNGAGGGGGGGAVGMIKFHGMLTGARMSPIATTFQ